MNTRYENMAKTFMTGYDHDLFVSEHVQTGAHILRQQVFDQYPFLWDASATEHSFLPYYLEELESFAAALCADVYEQWDEYVAAGHVADTKYAKNHDGIHLFLPGMIDYGVLSFDQFDLHESLPGWLTLIVTLRDAHALGEISMVFEYLVKTIDRGGDYDTGLSMITTVLVEHTFIATHDALEQVEIRDHVPWEWQHPLIVEQFVPRFLEQLAHVPQLLQVAEEYAAFMQSMDEAIKAAGF